jgi:hypothetical protein
MTSPSTGLIELDRDDLTVLDIALSMLADVQRKNPDVLPTVNLHKQADQLHRNVLLLKRGDG